MADSKSLSLQEFLSLSDHEERILIVSDVSKGNTLIRMYEKNADMVRNISCENINRIADTICEYELSKKGYDIAANTIDDDEALMLFRHCILFKCIDDGELKYFTNEDILDIATTQELFSTRAGKIF